MAKLIELSEAAAMLGVSPDELNDMRSRNEIFGYRDGASWKFKQEEIDRVKEELAESSGPAAGSGDELSLADEDDLSDRTIDADASEFFGNDEDSDLEDSGLEDSDMEDNSESILVSEEELGQSERSTSSTIIGKTDDAQSAGDSDLRLADDADETPSPAEQSDIQLTDSDTSSADKDPAEMSDLNLTDDDEISSGSDITSGSDIGLSGGSDVDLDGSDLGLAGSSILGGGSDKASGSDLSLDDDDDEALELATDADDDLELGEDMSLGGSGISLDDDDDGELVLDGGSDVTLSGDSGINLSMPTDSGLSLEDEPMELSGSGISSLELPEGDDEDQVISLEEEEADPEAATQLKADNDFMLTPVEGDEDDPSDSGSQVIALDTEELDAEAATQLGMAGGMDNAFEAAPDDHGVYDTEPSGVDGPAPAYAGAEMVPAELPESPYSIWQVMSLFIVVLMLVVSGMLMMDVIRNMWSFDQPYAANTSIMDMILDAVGKSK
jgi:hypothetical protein